MQQGTWGGYAVREPQRSAPVTSDSAVGPVGAILDFPYWARPQTLAWWASAACCWPCCASPGP